MLEKYETLEGLIKNLSIKRRKSIIIIIIIIIVLVIIVVVVVIIINSVRKIND